ncbi:MAG TPA: hypothetical protein VG758_33485 [Hyphomicrobiaceae bacterium]|jgi:hypothetical protein|nr:hypothetical protein [Hyphomicrobiaceae bacterium]
MLILSGALLSGVLGALRWGWWAPAAAVCATLALQAVAYQGVLSTADGMSGLAQTLALTGITCLIVFYAAFSIGRSLALRWRKHG